MSELTIEERLAILERYAHTNCYKCGKEVLVSYLENHPLCKAPLCHTCFRKFEEFADNAKNDYLNKIENWLYPVEKGKLRGGLVC